MIMIFQIPWKHWLLLNTNSSGSESGDDVCFTYRAKPRVTMAKEATQRAKTTAGGRVMMKLFTF